MAYQGLFTQGPTVDDLLQKRNKRQQDMQQQLMNDAAQGARDPQRARMGSMFGSIIGRALGNNAGGADTEMEKLKAQQEAQATGQATYMGAMQSNNSANMLAASQGLAEAYPKASLELLAASRAAEVVEKKAIKDSNDAVALQDQAATYGNDLTTWNPELAYRLVSGNATKDEVKLGMKETANMNKETNGGNKDPLGYTFNAGGTFVDLQGNRYVVTNSINKDTQENTALYTPIGNAPEYTNAPLSPVDSTGMTRDGRIAEDLARRKGENQMKKLYNHKEKAATDIGQTTTNLRDSRRMLELIKLVETGGASVLVGKAVSDFFGVTPTSVSELDTISKTMMLASLKSLLGGQLSDGERKAATEVQVALEKGKGANRAITERYISIFEAKLEREQKALGSDTTPAGYYTFLIDQSLRMTAQPTNTASAVTTSTAPKVFKWNSNSGFSGGTPANQNSARTNFKWGL
tara:strand:+ start:208 stop:1599 length:1392 start_codon:yes stop_codon:yes gene_type:complete